MAIDVFLSHRGVTKEFIVRLAAFLEQDEENRLTCWYAPRNIEKAHDYGTEIYKGIQEAKIVLVYLTDQFGDSNSEEEENYVKNEVVLARDLNKMILPVFHNRDKFPESLNIHLNNRQTFSMNDFDDEEIAMKELQNTLLKLRGKTIRQSKFMDMKQEITERQEQSIQGFTLVSKQLMRNYQEQFIHTDYFQRLPQNQHALTIYGPPESGKMIHAVNYLLAQNKATIYETRSMDVLLTLLKTKIPKNAGFIIRSNSTEVNTITEANMDHLSSRLKEVNSSLIICSNEANRIIPSYEVKFLTAGYELVTRMLKTKLPGDFSRVEPYLNVLKLNVPEESLTSISIMNDYVTQIITAAENEIATEDFIHTVHYLKNNRLSEMFSTLHVTELFYPLSVSLNSDRSFKQVHTTYLELCALFKKTYPDIPIQNMELSKQDVINKFELKVYEGIGNNHFASFIEEKINFSIPHLEKKVWLNIWNNYPILHSVLSTYLLQLVDSKKKYHINNAIEIMEDILQDNLHENMGYFLTDLAKSSRSNHNIIASELISKLAENPKYSNHLFKLIKTWMNSGNLNYVDTALLSILSEIGIDNLPEAIALLLERLFKCPDRQFSILETLSSLATLVHLYEPLDIQFFESLKEMLRDFYLDKELNDAYDLVLAYFQYLFQLEPSIYFDSQYSQKEKLLVSTAFENMKKNSVEFTVDLMVEFLKYCKQHPVHKDAGRTFYLSLKERCHNQGFSSEFNRLERLVNN